MIISAVKSLVKLSEPPTMPIKVAQNPYFLGYVLSRIEMYFRIN